MVAALRERVTPHHRFLLRLHLTQINALEVAARGVPRAPSSLIAFVECEYDGRRAPSTNKAVQKSAHPAIPSTARVRMLITAMVSCRSRT